jgi:hypothetical protein
VASHRTRLLTSVAACHTDNVRDARYRTAGAYRRLADAAAHVAAAIEDPASTPDVISHWQNKTTDRVVAVKNATDYQAAVFQAATLTSRVR